MRSVALICAFLLGITTANAESATIFPSETYRTNHENYALAYHSLHKTTKLENISLEAQNIKKYTVCNAAGLGPATYGCDFYSASKSSAFKEVKFRGGIAKNQVGVGVNLTW